MRNVSRLLQKTAIYGKRHIVQQADYFLEKGWSSPERVTMCLTRRCNAKCLMCDFWQTKTLEQDEIPSKRWIEIVEELHGWLGTFFLSLTGGEVFIKEGIYDIIKRAVDLNISVDVVTNGLAFRSDKNLQKLFDTGLPSITFSVDGVAPDVHDKYRGVPGAYGIVEEVIRKIKQQGPKMVVTVTCIVMEETISHLDKYVHWAQGLGVNRVNFQPILPNLRVPDKSGPRKGNIDKSDRFVYDLDVVNRMMDNLVSLKQSTGIIGNTIDNLEKIKEYFKNPDIVQIRQGRCMLGQSNLGINEYGNMWLCHKIGDRFIGNINDGMIKNTWKSPKAKNVRRAIKDCSLPCMALCYRSLTMAGKIAMFYKFAKMGKI